MRGCASSDGTVCRAGRGGWWSCIAPFHKWSVASYYQRILRNRYPKLPHGFTPYVGLWWRDMRAGGPTKTSSDLGSVFPGALSARVDSRRIRAYREAISNCQQSRTARDPAPSASKCAWLLQHWRHQIKTAGSLTLCHRLARRSGTR